MTEEPEMYVTDIPSVTLSVCNGGYLVTCPELDPKPTVSAKLTTALGIAKRMILRLQETDSHAEIEAKMNKGAKKK